MVVAGEVKIQAAQSSCHHHGNWGLASLTFFGESTGKNFSPHDVSYPSSLTVPLRKVALQSLLVVLSLDTLL